MDQAADAQDPTDSVDSHLWLVSHAPSPREECYGSNEKGYDVPGIYAGTYSVESVPCDDKQGSDPLYDFICFVHNLIIRSCSQFVNQSEQGLSVVF